MIIFTKLVVLTLLLHNSFSGNKSVAGSSGGNKGIERWSLAVEVLPKQYGNNFIKNIR